MFTNDTASILLTLIQLLALIVLIAGGSVALGALGRYLLGRIGTRPAEAPGAEAAFRPRAVDGGAARTPAEAIARGGATAVQVLQPDAVVAQARLAEPVTTVVPEPAAQAEAPAQAAEVAPQPARRPVPVLARSSRSARRWTAAQERSGRHASARWA